MANGGASLPEEQLANLALVPNMYLSQVATNYANALLLATGTQKKIITVLADETDNSNKNRYFYEGVSGELDIIF